MANDNLDNLKNTLNSLNGLRTISNETSNSEFDKEQLKILVKEVLNEIMEEQGTPYNG